ncbi:hypothetical protein SASPL_134598 [Salvia splendens]|uniref:Uncharacterized protein n=1 Tax=Salvia splendens TaxID=180675 RepID=A0A8X8WV01_SALSN|nr:hypothetical protein SASPL_134598 [Salvia splendens]
MFWYLTRHQSIHVSSHLKKVLAGRGFGARKMDACSTLYSVTNQTTVLVFMWWPQYAILFYRDSLEINKFEAEIKKVAKSEKDAPAKEGIDCYDAVNE